MKKFTRKEIENMNVVEINNLAIKLGLSIKMAKSFTLTQKISYIYNNQ